MLTVDSTRPPQPGVFDGTERDQVFSMACKNCEKKLGVFTPVSTCFVSLFHLLLLLHVLYVFIIIIVTCIIFIYYYYVYYMYLLLLLHVLYVFIIVITCIICIYYCYYMYYMYLFNLFTIKRDLSATEISTWIQEKSLQQFSGAHQETISILGV